MSDHAIYDEDFFAEQERPKSLRKQVGDWINRYRARTGKSFSIAWRSAYLALEEATGFRVPEMRGLDAVEKAGLMGQLLEVATNLSGPCADHATEINDRIPAFVPHKQPERKIASIQHDAIEVTPYESPHPHRNQEQESEVASETTQTCPHEWGVFSTCVTDVCLLVQCVECGSLGKVSDPTLEEWTQAFHAPSSPYHWPHGDRVTVLAGRQADDSMWYIRRMTPDIKIGP